jgi:hypothetical protein
MLLNFCFNCEKRKVYYFNLKIRITCNIDKYFISNIEKYFSKSLFNIIKWLENSKQLGIQKELLTK